MLKRTLLVLMTAALVSGCETTGDGTKFVDTGCTWSKPILVHRTQDVLTDETARQILAHNQTGAKRCGWKPTRPDAK
jgi:hypothetical protein